jgi:hypothetical protein
MEYRLVLRFSEFGDVVKFKNIENKWYPKLGFFIKSDLILFYFIEGTNSFSCLSL